MANERALGLSFIYAAQTWRQMVVSYGEDEARSLFGLTNNLVVFGGGKDIHFYREISDLIGDVRISRQTVSDGPGGVGTSRAGEDVRILRPGDIRRIGNGTPWSSPGTRRRSSPGCAAAWTGAPAARCSRNWTPPATGSARPATAPGSRRPHPRRGRLRPRTPPARRRPTHRRSPGHR